ncbi:hypothetical protein [Pedobacter sp. B4-66]|uniref:hypothetical protein n=1 Tax=Pedobacter sp. B4-66 TaxID=2817280 RepID=UPI001BD9EF6B|nr:hypothetical protein [Pedobacter sp. B4-66]
MKNKYLPVMPDGNPIPNVVKDSMELIVEPELSDAGYCKLKLEVYLKMEDVKEAMDNAHYFPGIINLTL